MYIHIAKGTLNDDDVDVVDVVVLFLFFCFVFCFLVPNKNGTCVYSKCICKTIQQALHNYHNRKSVIEYKHTRSTRMQRVQ